jgi:hypothetical protein
MDGAPNNPSGRQERRGMDPAVLEFLRELGADFTSAHEREHALAEAAANAALELAAQRLTEEIKAVREYFDTILNERDQRYAERFDAQQIAVQAALAEREKAVLAAFLASEKAISAAAEASKEAIAKSEVGVEKRADAVYVTLSKLQESLAVVMPRSEAENRFGAQAQIIDELRKTMEVNTLDLRDRLKAIEATKQGAVEFRSESRDVTQTWAPWVVALVALIGVAVTIAVSIGGKT